MIGPWNVLKTLYDTTSIPSRLCHILHLCAEHANSSKKYVEWTFFRLKGVWFCLSVKKISSPPQAIDHFKIILSFQEANGEIWSALGHCYLMQENLQEAYQAYQQALYHLKNPRVSDESPIALLRNHLKLTRHPAYRIRSYGMGSGSYTTVLALSNMLKKHSLR